MDPKETNIELYLINELRNALYDMMPRDLSNRHLYEKTLLVTVSEYLLDQGKGYKTLEDDKIYMEYRDFKYGKAD